MQKPSRLLFFLFFFLSYTGIAAAHLIGGNGLSSGLAHPFFGPDHLLAMVAVGIISTQAGGRKGIIAVPMAFVASMVFGGALAIAGIPLPAVETGIGISVLVLGIMIAFSKKIPMKWAIACVAIFALFHGHAHGEELSAISNPALYVFGFVFSTAVLHITGALVGHYAKKTEFTFNALRAAGALMAIAGLFFLFFG